MEKTDQETICKALAITCMWGQGGIASVFLERLDQVLPTDPSWDRIYAAVAKQAKREYMGVLDDDEQLKWYIQRGYWLCNYDADGCSLFNPPPMNGLCMYVSKDLAAKYPDKWK